MLSGQTCKFHKSMLDARLSRSVERGDLSSSKLAIHVPRTRAACALCLDICPPCNRHFSRQEVLVCPHLQVDPQIQAGHRVSFLHICPGTEYWATITQCCCRKRLCFPRGPALLGICESPRCTLSSGVEPAQECTVEAVPMCQITLQYEWSEGVF